MFDSLFVCWVGLDQLSLGRGCVWLLLLFRPLGEGGGGDRVAVLPCPLLYL